MIQVEYLNEGTLIRHYSDSGLSLLQTETGIKYPEAVDIVPCPYTYLETDELIEQDAQLDEVFITKNSEEVSSSSENIDEILESEVIVNG